MLSWVGLVLDTSFCLKHNKTWSANMTRGYDTCKTSIPTQSFLAVVLEHLYGTAHDNQDFVAKVRMAL